MRSLTRSWKVMSIAMVAAGLLAAGCGDSNNSTPAPATVTVSGKVIQGPVAGARVFADRAPYDNVWESTEEFTFSDANGDYTFPALDGDFRICTEGGSDTLTNAPAVQLIAPKGAKNVTPLTTLVALDPSVKATLNALAGSTTDVYDLDPTAGLSPELMTILKSVEATVELFTNTLGVTDTASQQSLVKTIATQLVSVAAANPTADTTTVLQTALKNAVADQIVALQDNTYTLADPAAAATAAGNAISDLVANIATTVNNATVDGVVQETTALNSDVNTQLDQMVQNTEISVETASVALTTYEVRDANGQNLDTNADANIIAVPAAQAAQVYVQVTGENSFATAKDYTGVSLKLQIVDKNSTRLATFTISGLGVSIATDGTVTIDDSAAKLTASAVDSAGNAITTKTVNGPFQSINVVNNSVTLDLPAIQDLLAAQVAADFSTISKAGTYSVTMTASGVPAVGKTVTLIAN